MLDAQGRETDDVVRGLGTLYTWNMWSPRLGLTMKLTGDGRTMLRGSYGRFNQGVLTGELAPFHPAAPPTTTAPFDPSTGGYTTIVSVVDPKRNLRLDPDTRAPSTDEYSIGVDREIGRALSVAIAYVARMGAISSGGLMSAATMAKRHGCCPTGARFGQPSAFIDPRRVMFGVRLNLGR